MKRAYEYDHELISNAVPKLLSDEEQTWEDAFDLDDKSWQAIQLLWGSHVPGSYAPERVLLGGILSMYNMGYDVTEAEKLIPQALKAREEGDKVTLTRLTARVFHIINHAKQIPGHPYLNYAVYDSFEKYAADVKFIKYPTLTMTEEELYKRIHAGWVAQIIGAAVGTALEGYTCDTLRKTFGEIKNYVRKPNTYNDDITYEIAFLEAFERSGYNVTSSEIAEEWVSRIPFAWSAEDIALKNIAMGIYPPESGYRSNPWREWIGAQMRGAVCGMVAPGDPETAARLAFVDGVVSHHNNGVIGEIFNAMLCSMAYVETDMRTIVKKAIDMIPAKSEYYTVVKFAWDACERSEDYLSAWKLCEQKYVQYNWIHAYPNAAAEVVALYFSNNNFDDCLNMISLMGQDVDCNAAQIMTLFGLAYGMDCIDSRWIDPIQDEFRSYVRGYEKSSISAIARKTVDCIRKYRS